MTTQYPIITQVRRYWEAQREDGEVPHRSRIDPRSLPHALPNVFLIERIAPGVTRFRVAGGVLSDLMGMDVRGMPFLSLIEPTERESLAPRIDALFDQAGQLNICLESTRAQGTPQTHGRILLLPLQSSRNVDQALGCIELHGEHGPAPVRFSPVRAQYDRLLLPPASLAHMGMAEDASPFASARPHLRLVHSSDAPYKVSNGNHR
ncbi:PAS domain-containing protein [Falsirhodobacter sp. alg1]|uniref:PAS domain-containing protein n=1 Tax=Falsirhodobacter sp. alg1 TaxID=1472418 RepID=UPI00078823CE|nr:PAS domain-containing protein [Falsirhodobacter sp. alg1]